MDTNQDELQKKIEAARGLLSQETKNAIDAVDWKAAILSMKEKKGYNLEQFQDLETETELLLCGLTNPENYPSELANRMKISQKDVDVIINELNESIFKKIREKLMENSQNTQNIENKDILSNAGIEIMPEEITAPYNPLLNKERAGGEVLEKRNDMLSDVENPELIKIQANKEKIESITAQKLSHPFQTPSIKTEYTLNNISKQNTGTVTPTNTPSTDISTKTIHTDPYREKPE